MSDQKDTYFVAVKVFLERVKTAKKEELEELKKKGKIKEVDFKEKKIVLN